MRTATRAFVLALIVCALASESWGDLKPGDEGGDGVPCRHGVTITVQS